MSNHLKNATSPYLLQHAENPVDWYPWCKQAFEKQNQKTNRFFSASVTVPVIGVMLWLMRALKIKKQQKF